MAIIQEFKIEADALTKRRETRVRLLSWGAVALCFAVTALLFALRLEGLLQAGSPFGGLAVLALLAGIIGAAVLACREALRSAERQMVFILEESGITRRRSGSPDVRISFSEIETLREEFRWLVIYSAEPRRRIAVPNDVASFEAIRAELAMHHALASKAKASLPWRGLALSAMAVLSWAAVLLSHGLDIFIPAALVAGITLAIGSHRFWVLMHRSPKRLLMWLSLSSIWLAAILVICIRVMGRWRIL